MDEHETSQKGEGRNNRHDDPDEAASEDGLEETSEEKEACSREYSCGNLSPVNWSAVGDRNGCVVGELFCEGGWVKSAGEIILGGISPSTSGFPGSFDGGIHRYDWGGHEVQLGDGVNT